MKHYRSEQVGMSVGAGQSQHGYACFGFVADRPVEHGTRFARLAARRNASPHREWRKSGMSVLVCGFTINGLPCHGCYTRRRTVSVRPGVFPSDAARCRISLGSGASVLVCGLEHGAVAHEFRKIAVDDAVALLDGIVTREDVLGVVVAKWQVKQP